MLKKPSLLGKETGRFLLIASMTGLLVGCGGSSSSDSDTDTDIPSSGQDFDLDGIPDADDNDADGDGLDDFNGEDNFVDLDGDGLDDITFLTEAEANAGVFVDVSTETPCGSERGTDNDSSTADWNDNCVVKRASEGGQFADSLFSVGIQRVLFCSGFGTGTDYTVFADGEYGPASETAAIAFQQSESIVADGIVGPQTWARLQERVERLEFGIVNESPDTYGFTDGVCANIPMFYQEISLADDGLSTVEGGWTLARNQPNQDDTVPFSYEEPFGRL